MIGLGATALWELWQRVSELVREGQQQRRNDPDRKRQAGGGRKKDALSDMSAPGDTALFEATLDDASLSGNDGMHRINCVELHP